MTQKSARHKKMYDLSQNESSNGLPDLLKQKFSQNGALPWFVSIHVNYA